MPVYSMAGCKVGGSASSAELQQEVEGPRRTIQWEGFVSMNISIAGFLKTGAIDE